MSLGSRLRRLRGSFRNNAFEESMEAELRHHLELEAEMLAARGMSTGSNPETIANRNARMLAAIGRLRPGATLQQVQGDLDAVSHRLVAADPAEYDQPRTGFRTAALMVRDELTRRASPSSTLPWRSITLPMPIQSAAASRSMTARPGSPSSGSSTTCASTISR